MGDVALLNFGLFQAYSNLPCREDVQPPNIDRTLHKQYTQDEP